MKIRIGAAVAAVIIVAIVIIRTWRKGSEVSTMLAYIKKLASAVRSDMNSAHTRVDEYARMTNRFSGRLHWLESQAKSVSERLWDSDTDRDKIEALEERVTALERGQRRRLR